MIMETLKSLSECESSNEVYDFFTERSNDFGSVDIIKTPITPNKKTFKTESDTSYSFQQRPNEDKKKCIERIFKIDLSNIPDNKIDHRITTIHSSALAALLCFHNISEYNPLSIELNGQTYTFVKAKIEYPNKCMEKGGRSKIDVALFGKDEKVVLFLEAKFSEYLDSECKEISAQYKKEPLFSNSDILPSNLEFIGLEDEKPLKIISKQRGKGRYREGIKQMLCHYIGATHYIKENPQKVFIGTLLFDFGERFKTEFDDYQTMYKELAINLNSLPEKRIELLSEVISYQTIFRFENNIRILPQKVRCFYNL